MLKRNSAVILPKYCHKVTIPKGGDFCFYTRTKYTKWQRFWLRFIGWEVEDVRDI